LNINLASFKPSNVGVGNENEILELYDYDTKDGSSHASLYRDVVKDLHKGNLISHFINIIALDQFLISQNIQAVDLLKIDTEGNEFNVLLECKKFLNSRKIKAIHFEFNEMNIVSKVSFKDFLKEYELYRILPGGKLKNIRQLTVRYMHFKILPQF
jgi:FkbM family methyltransferase